MTKIYVHGSYIGNTGYNNHTRDFFRELSKHLQIKVRNFTIGDSWSGLSDTPHDNEPYINDVDKSILYQQRLWVEDGKMSDFKIYPSEKKEFLHDFNIVLNETNHYLYYDKYIGPKIAYNVWESTRQPENFFNKLLEFDEIWVPSEWQRECTIEQGANPDKVKVVPEGVDVHTFYPETVEKLDEYKDGRFKFLLMGRWDYRKSTKEIIETFLRTFSPDEPIDLVVSIDNMWGEQMDGFKTTEERLANYGLTDSRIKIIHFPSREDYIKYLKTGHVFVSCARSEGWNLPLIEAMACGTPSIYSECSAQMEFAKGRGLPVKIVGEKPANENDYGRYTMSDLPGNYYEPDFDDLSRVMRDAYSNYTLHKQKSIEESKELRDKFSWEKIALIGKERVDEFMSKISSGVISSLNDTNQIKVSYLEGPKVEVVGDFDSSYFVEFIDGDGKVRHSDTITNNMWTSCGVKYYVPWTIKINGKIVDQLKLENKKVLISFESKSVGDTIAWAPYAIELMKQKNCKVILSTFHNDWFKGLGIYKDIEFINPGEVVKCDVIYRLGWFRDDNGGWRNFNSHPNQPNLIPLQKTATDILGLEFKEVNHGVKYKLTERLMNSKYVVFGPQSTAGCKEWSFDHWVELTKLVKDMGYSVVILSLKEYKIDGTINVTSTDWDEVFSCLYHSEFFVGLSSGLSWANWALNKKTIMISAFSEVDHEFTSNVIRVSNNICIKCWNDPVHVFDTGDWDWCPVYKGTERQHICQKSITPEMVIKEIKNIATWK